MVQQQVQHELGLATLARTVLKLCNPDSLLAVPSRQVQQRSGHAMLMKGFWASAAWDQFALDAV